MRTRRFAGDTRKVDGGGGLTGVACRGGGGVLCKFGMMRCLLKRVCLGCVCVCVCVTVCVTVWVCDGTWLRMTRRCALKEEENEVKYAKTQSKSAVDDHICRHATECLERPTIVNMKDWNNRNVNVCK